MTKKHVFSWTNNREIQWSIISEIRMDSKRAMCDQFIVLYRMFCSTAVLLSGSNSTRIEISFIPILPIASRVFLSEQITIDNKLIEKK